VYSLYITSSTEDVSCVLRDELAVVASINAYPRERLRNIFYTSTKCASETPSRKRNEWMSTAITSLWAS
jgi:hypothetical protein